MEQRIKIVWSLSLLSMLLIVCGQGYWLWNQYQYKNEEYCEEVRSLVMESVAVNDSIREKMPKKFFGKPNVYFYNVNSNMNEECDSLTGKRRISTTNTLIIGITSQRPSEGIAQLNRSKSPDYRLWIDSLSFSDTIVVKDAGRYYDQTNLLQPIQKYQLQIDAPFSLQRFDSLLATRLPDISFTTRLAQTEGDTIFQWKETVERFGNAFVPGLRIRYPYNPLKRELVQMELRIPPHALLLRMSGQLAGSLLLILLLACCLLFQIKTILKQRRIDELRRSFVNTMIHELKRPVQTLKMCVAFLDDKAMRTDEQTMDNVVHDSLSELDNLSGYLQKLRDMTRADDERTQLTISTFQLLPVVEKLLKLYRSPEGKQVTFETRISPSSPVVTADPVHISNILGNLLENAVKYSGPAVHICLECLREPHRLLLRVTDDGIGIPLSEQGRVFDKFYRGSNLPDRSLPGIGLGLSYVKLLVEAHRGSIRLTSQPGKGTRIEIEIPQ